MGCTREEAVQITRPPGGRVFPHPPAGPLRQVAGPAGSGAPAGHSRLALPPGLRAAGGGPSFHEKSCPCPDLLFPSYFME